MCLPEGTLQWLWVKSQSAPCSLDCPLFSVHPSSPVPTSLLDSNPNTHIHSTTQSLEYIHHKPFLFSFLPLKAEFTEISIYCHSPLPYFTFLFQPSPTHFLTPLKLLLSKGWLVYYKENRIISGRLGLGEKNQCL